MKEELIQLRNHHLKQGKNNDRTPIYPIVKPEGIKGLVEYLLNHDIGGGVTKVDSLPEEGEAGKIYYNTTTDVYYVYDTHINDYTVLGQDIISENSLPNTGESGKIYYLVQDNKYYIYDSSLGFVELGYAHIPISTSTEPSPSGLIERFNYILPNKLYNDCFSYISNTDVRVYTINLMDYDAELAQTYTFRITFAVSGDSVNIVFAQTIVIPDITQEVLSGIEANHTYEFNIFGGVLLVTDITHTESVIQTKDKGFINTK